MRGIFRLTIGQSMRVVTCYGVLSSVHFSGWENNQAREQTIAPMVSCHEAYFLCYSRYSIVSFAAVMGSSRNASRGGGGEKRYSPPRKASPNISHCPPSPLRGLLILSLATNCSLIPSLERQTNYFSKRLKLSFRSSFDTCKLSDETSIPSQTRTLFVSTLRIKLRKKKTLYYNHKNNYYRSSFCI